MRITVTLSLLAALLIPAATFAAISPADICRAISMTFAGDPGAVGGAVNDIAGDHQFDAFLTPALAPPGVTLTTDRGTE